MNHPASSGERRSRLKAMSRSVVIGMMFSIISAPFLPTCLGAHLENPDLGDMTVGVLLYLDDGQYCWTDVPMTGNFTALCATIAACTALDVPLNYSMSQYGAYVTALFGTGTPPDFSWWWELLLWNSTANAWQEAPLGASDLHPEPWSSIAWCPNSSAPPLPDPLTRYPWPKFRHDLANLGTAQVSFSAEQNHFSSFLSGSYGPIDSSPAIAHGRIFVSTGGVYNWSRMVYESAPRLWSYPINGGGAYWHRDTTAAGWQVSSPVVGGGKVIIGTSDGKVLAYAMEDLKPSWNFSIAASSTGVTSSPVISQGTVYVAGGDGQLYALSLDGNLLWNISLGGPVYMSSPAISNGRLFVGSDAGILTCAGLNGTILWNFTTEGKIRSSPAVSGDNVFFEDTVYDGFTAVRSSFFALRADSGTQEWNKTIPAATSSPAIAGEKIFLGTNTGVLALDFSGTQLWFCSTAGPVQSSPAIAGGSVMVTENSPNGSLRILSISDGRELNRFTPHPSQYIFSSPVCTDIGLFFASDNGQVYYSGNLRYSYLKVVEWEIPHDLKAGKPVEIKVRITNNGNMPARELSLSLHDRNPPGMIDTPINVSHLSPGKNITVIFNWTPGEGTHHLWIKGGPEDYWTEVHVPEKWHYPAMLDYISGAFFITFAAVAFIILRKKGRKGGRVDEP